MEELTEAEQLGEIFYEAYCTSKYNRASEIVPWDMQPAFWRKDWIAGAKAVAEHVLAELQTGVEASE